MDNKGIDPKILNTMFTLLANFSSEEQSKVEEIREEYKEREHKRELEHAKNIACLNNRNKISLAIIGLLGTIIIVGIVVFGFIVNNTINKHYEMDRLYQEDIVVEFESEIEDTTDKDTFDEITTGENARIGSNGDNISIEGSNNQITNDDSGGEK